MIKADKVMLSQTGDCPRRPPLLQIITAGVQPQLHGGHPAGDQGPARLDIAHGDVRTPLQEIIDRIRHHLFNDQFRVSPPEAKIVRMR